MYLDRTLNDERWRSTVDDKLNAYAILGAGGIPYPTIRAIYSPVGRRLAGAQLLLTVPEVFQYLATGAAYPLFVKPVQSSYGRGAMGLAGFDPSRAYGRFVPLRDLHGAVYSRGRRRFPASTSAALDLGAGGPRFESGCPD